MQGTIKRVIRDRGFGFIRAADGQEIFCRTWISSLCAKATTSSLNWNAVRRGPEPRTSARLNPKFCGYRSFHCDRPSASGLSALVSQSLRAAVRLVSEYSKTSPLKSKPRQAPEGAALPGLWQGWQDSNLRPSD